MRHWKRRYKDEWAEMIRPLRAAGLTYPEIGEAVGTSRETVRRICDLFGIEKCAFSHDIDLDVG